MENDNIKKRKKIKKPVEPVNPDDEKLTGKEILSMILYVVVVFFIALFIIKFIGQRTTVSGSSMENTLSDGDNIIIDKVTYRFSEPKRFDIVVFPYQYDEDTYYIKRIIGLPGETVQIMATGDIYINGEMLIEDYGREIIENAGSVYEPKTLGPDEYFVLGDNRNNSSDSRFENVGMIHKSKIIGRAWVRIYPFNKLKLLTGGRK